MNILMNRIIPSFVSSAVFSLLVGCGGTDTGQENAVNESVRQDDVDDTLVYNGPAAANDDVVLFKQYLWDFLATSDKCGGCHSEEVGREPLFMARDDINIAYDAVLPLVDKEAPQLSRLVERVEEGHEDWSPAAPTIMAALIGQWAAASGVSSDQIVLIPPTNPKEVGVSRQFPADTDLFERTIYELVRTTETAGCGDCHAEDTVQKQQPFFASVSVDTAYAAVRTLIELDEDNISSSRLIQRVNEGHKIWADEEGVISLVYSVQEMTDAVRAFITDPSLDPVPIPEEWLVSSASNIADDGQLAGTGGREQDDVIALYLFKQGEGGIVYDVSPVEPALNLNLSDDYEWLSSGGIRFNGIAKAQGTDADSRKLHDRIKLTGEFSIEAWVVPGNITQEDARIVTYSANNMERNFSLYQNLYDYQFLSRSENTGANGDLLSTPSDDEVLQATQQHVVATYDPIEGRRIYVNGELISEDGNGDMAGSINDWESSFVLALGNEVDNANSWSGSIRLLAIHDRVLTDEQVLNNFEAGVGQRYYVYFEVSDYVDHEDAFVVFQVEIFDDTSYLFDSPFFIILDGEDTVPTEEFYISGMRIGINGKEAAIGQSFANINIPINSTTYDPTTGADLYGDPSNPDGNPGPSGTVIALENGLQGDVFFLTFEQIGNCGAGCTYTRDVEPVSSRPALIAADAVPDIGLRVFDEVFQNMSAITTVPSSLIYRFYADEIRRSLPSAASADGFLASQQAAVTQLALAYCNELVNTPEYHDAYFGDYGSLSSQGEKDALIDPLLNRMWILADGSVATSADVDDIKLRLDNVGVDDQEFADPDVPEDFDGLLQVMSGNTVERRATAVCTSVLASAAMLMQ